MSGNERWVPCLGYELVRIPGEKYLICRKGNGWYRNQVAEEDLALRPILEATDYGEAVGALHALRATMTEPANEPESPDASPLVGASGGVALIAAERRRQLEEEGWTAEHDDMHTDGELRNAAGCYVWSAGLEERGQWPPGQHGGWPSWPWWDERVYQPQGWNPSTMIGDLVKAGALIAAEIDRILRANAG